MKGREPMADKAEKKDKKSKRKHLHQIRSVYAHDGSVVHHHTYKSDSSDDHTEPERVAASSQNADEAGQHVADNFGQNEMSNPSEQQEPTEPEQGAEQGQDPTQAKE
jgi:hypothetical protein